METALEEKRMKERERRALTNLVLAQKNDLGVISHGYGSSKIEGDPARLGVGRLQFGDEFLILTFDFEHRSCK